MSRSWLRVGSPSPGRSILMTSAPNHARIWVHVGPDCTCVISRIRTPSKAFPMIAPFLEMRKPFEPGILSSVGTFENIGDDSDRPGGQAGSIGPRFETALIDPGKRGRMPDEWFNGVFRDLSH